MSLCLKTPKKSEARFLWSFLAVKMTVKVEMI